MHEQGHPTFYIDLADEGYKIYCQHDDGVQVYPERIADLKTAVSCVMSAKEALELQGVKANYLVSARCIEANRGRDVSARRLWNNPEFQATGAFNRGGQD